MSLVTIIMSSTLLVGSPSIIFTYVPPTGSYANVTGTVSGASPSTYGVALFINIFGTYWTKPYFAQPIVTLAGNGTFSASITTGGTGSLDAYAEQVIAFVVPLSYAIPTLAGASSIPQEVYDNSIASVVANKYTPIPFNGRFWEVKDTGNGTWGPSVNYFTSSNVTVDGQGRLHLAISYSGGQWRCSEVILTNSYGYGTYRVWLDNDLSSLPANIVFGFFTWNNHPAAYADSYREIDVEFSNGAVVGSPTNWQYVIQPYNVVGNRTNFSAPSTGMSSSTHSFTWMPNAVYFESYTNHVADQRTFSILSTSNFNDWIPVAQTNISAGTSNTISIAGQQQNSQSYRAKMVSSTGTPSPFKAVWFTNGVPPPGGEQLHFNMWLYNGAAPSPTTSDRFEVIISKVEFIPLTNLAPRLQIMQVTNNQVKMNLKYRTN